MFDLLAYFDPGSGSMLVQALVGGTAGLMVFGKYMWNALFVRVPAQAAHVAHATPGDRLAVDRRAASSQSSVEIPVTR